MAEQWIDKEVSRKDKETGKNFKTTARYRIDPDFIPASSTEVCQEFIEEYCVANGELDWLIAEAEKTVIDKNGKERANSFPQIRAEFMKKFFPDKIKGKEVKAPWAERLKERRANGATTGSKRGTKK